MACESYVRTQQLQGVDAEDDSDEFKDDKALGSEVKKGFRRCQENRRDRKKHPKNTKKTPNNFDKIFTRSAELPELSEQELMDLREGKKFAKSFIKLSSAGLATILIEPLVHYLSRFTPADDAEKVKSPSRVVLDEFAAVERIPSFPNDIVKIIDQYVGETHFKFKDGTRTFKEMSPAQINATYRDELKKSVETNTEPSYLKTILDERASKIATLIEAKEKGLDTREALRGHAHNILVVMVESNAIALFAVARCALSAAASAVFNAAWFFPRSRVAKSAVESAVESAAWTTAVWRAVKWNDFGYSSSLVPAVRSAGEKAFTGVAASAVENELYYLKLTNPDEIGKYAYRIAEKAALIHLLRQEKEIFNAVYQASNNQEVLPLKHFSSQEAWNAFRKKHFGKLKQEQYQFFRPYLEAIDRIVAKTPAK